ncbi:MAG: phenylphosphate carboxylase subunit gamma [Dehalococcoidia bacterium]|nr:phenylphosphate carboxylase subunit gamma [Dehalococcoidia bacterium]
MKKEFMMFVSDLSELVEKKEVTVAVRDLTQGPRKYDCKIVKAVLSSSADLPGGDVLWIWSWTGVPHPKPWSIKIKGEVGETLPGRPHDETLSNLSLN